MKKKNKDFSHISDILDNALSPGSKKAGSDLTAIWDAWDDIVNEHIAENARPAAFKTGILIVHVTSSTWMHQLQFVKKDIIQKINSAQNNKIIKEIKFKIGPVET